MSTSARSANHFGDMPQSDKSRVLGGVHAVEPLYVPVDKRGRRQRFQFVDYQSSSPKDFLRVGLHCNKISDDRLQNVGEPENVRPMQADDALFHIANPPLNFHPTDKHRARRRSNRAGAEREAFEMRIFFDSQTCHPPSSFGTETMAHPFSELPETIDNSLETVSSARNSRHPYGNACGEERSRVASPQALMRELADLIAPRQPAKVLYPLLAADLRRYCPNISDRRVRSLFNGEVSRIWDDEALAIRMALSHRRNTAARRAFARAAADMEKFLASEGVPLTQEQRRAVAGLADGAFA